MVDSVRAVDLVIGLLSAANIEFKDAAGNNRLLHNYDIYGGYVGDRARRASVIVQPSTRSTAYAEEQHYPVKVYDSFVIAINVVSKTFSKNQQDQLISVCDKIQDAIERRGDFNQGEWKDRTGIPVRGEVWDQDGQFWMIENENDGIVPPDDLAPPYADMLVGEVYIKVTSVDYNDEIQFGVRRAENVATIYATIDSNPHIGLV